MKKILSFLLVAMLLCLLFCVPAFAEDQYQRPVWIISHQCNSPIEHVKAAVDAGINAIEVDVRYSFSQGCWVLHHDAAGCQWAYKLSDLFAQPGLGDQICLILFDMKEPEYIVEQDLVGTTHALMKQNGISSNDLRIVYSVSSLDSVNTYFTPQFLNSLNSNEGICVDYENDVAAVSNAFASKGFDRTWYANGIFSGMDLTGNIEASCRDAAKRRDNGEFKKVESWTVTNNNASTGFKARLIDWGCDVLIVDDSERDNALSYLRSSDFNSVRLATADDDPFEYYGFSNYEPDTDAYYIIHSALDPNYCLDINGGLSAKNDGDNLHLWPVNEASANVFKFEKDNNTGAYKIIAAHSGKVLDIAELSVFQGANIYQWSDNGTDNQRWLFKTVSGGDSVYIKCILDDVTGWMDASGCVNGGMPNKDNGGTNIQSWTFTGNPNQLWILEEVEYNATGSFISEGNLGIIIALSVLALGGIVAVIIVNKKKKLAPSEK